MNACPIPALPELRHPRRLVSVAIGQWAVAAAPVKIRTLLGSCVGVVLYDRVARVGGLAHIVLPNSRGATDHPGKFADTAIPAMIAEIERQLKAQARGRLVAKLRGRRQHVPHRRPAESGPEHRPDESGGRGADSRVNCGSRSSARDLGGGSGRHLTLDTASGIVAIRIPGGADYEL